MHTQKPQRTAGFGVGNCFKRFWDFVIWGVLATVCWGVTAHGLFRQKEKEKLMFWIALIQAVLSAGMVVEILTGGWSP